MTADGWRQVIVHAVETARAGQESALTALCERLAALEAANVPVPKRRGRWVKVVPPEGA